MTTTNMARWPHVSRELNMVRLPDVTVDVEFARKVRGRANELGSTFSDLARTALANVLYEPPPYTLDGRGPSLVRDVWSSLREFNQDATGRLEKFRQWSAERTTFAASTGTTSEVVPPQYDPAAFPGILEFDRPLVSAATSVSISAPTPFTVPGPATAAGAIAGQVEGSNVAAGTVAVDPITVTPKGFSGLFQVTREIADSSNPAIDALAVAAMQESYAEQTEAVVYAELNGPNGQGGSITGAFVPSGAQVAAVDGDAPLLATGLKAAIAGYSFARGRKARTAFTSKDATTALSGVLDELSGDDQAMWRVQGVPINPAPVMLADGATDAAALLLSADDLWAWESPTLQFHYPQRNGPALIDLALFGYFAVRLLRPVGLSSVRYTSS